MAALAVRASGGVYYGTVVFCLARRISAGFALPPDRFPGRDARVEPDAVNLARALENGAPHPHVIELLFRPQLGGTRSWIVRAIDIPVTYFFNARIQEKIAFMNIYVGNLPYTVADSDLREVFSAYGEVTSSSVIADKFSGQSKGFGFVEMPNNSEADQAIKALNDSSLQGRNIKVNQAKPRSERPQRGPRF